LRSGNTGYFNLSISSAVALLLVKAFPSFLLIGYDGVAFYLVNDLNLHFCFHCVTDGQFAIRINKEHIEGYRIAGFSLNMGDVQSLIFLYFELLSGYFYYCYHSLKLGMQR